MSSLGAQTTPKASMAPKVRAPTKDGDPDVADLGDLRHGPDDGREECRCHRPLSLATGVGFSNVDGAQDEQQMPKTAVDVEKRAPGHEESAKPIRFCEKADVSAATTWTSPNMKLNFAMPNHLPPI